MFIGTRALPRPIPYSGRTLRAMALYILFTEMLEVLTLVASSSTKC